MSESPKPQKVVLPVGGDGRFDFVASISDGTDGFFSYEFFLNPKTPDALQQLRRAFDAAKAVPDAVFESVFIEGKGMCYGGISNVDVIHGLVNQTNLKEKCTPPKKLLDSLTLDFVLRDKSLGQLADFLHIPAQETAKAR